MKNTHEYMEKLYQTVDNLDVNTLSNFLHDDVVFQFSNANPVAGKNAVLDVNRQFFDSITSMSHTLKGSWQQGSEHICNGQVDYVRKDGSQFSALFATILTTREGLITNYRIYADVSEL